MSNKKINKNKSEILIEKKIKREQKEKRNNIIVWCVFFIFILAIVGTIIILNFPITNELVGEWIPQKAISIETGKEVELASIYNAKASNYQGRMIFNTDNTFVFWMGIGDQTDGTHSGSYKFSNEKIELTFDEGTVVNAEYKKDGNSTTQILCPYDGYTIYFEKNL